MPQAQERVRAVFDRLAKRANELNPHRAERHLYPRPRFSCHRPAVDGDARYRHRGERGVDRGRPHCPPATAYSTRTAWTAGAGVPPASRRSAPSSPARHLATLPSFASRPAACASVSPRSPNVSTALTKTLITVDQCSCRQPIVQLRKQYLEVPTAQFDYRTTLLNRDVSHNTSAVVHRGRVGHLDADLQNCHDPRRLPPCFTALESAGSS